LRTFNLGGAATIVVFFGWLNLTAISANFPLHKIIRYLVLINYL
jgi:hypothetical protein